jgi:hypothetical protein
MPRSGPNSHKRGSVPIVVRRPSRLVRFVRLFWLPTQSVPPEGTRERVEYDALQRSVLGWWYDDWVGSRRVSLFLFFLVWIVIVLSSYLSLDPYGTKMWFVRLGATAAFVGIAWRWLERRS